jgi:hypothetical protein
MIGELLDGENHLEYFKAMVKGVLGARELLGMLSVLEDLGYKGWFNQSLDRGQNCLQITLVTHISTIHMSDVIGRDL